LIQEQRPGGLDNFSADLIAFTFSAFDMFHE
jgi:hypothetical protein